MSLTRVRNLNRILPTNAYYMICDIQERFRPLIHQMEPVINRSLLVHKACKSLNIPCLITEQYSKVFGKTVPEIPPFADTKVFEKKQFSMLTPEVAGELAASGRTHVRYPTVVVIRTVVISTLRELMRSCFVSQLVIPYLWSVRTPH